MEGFISYLLVLFLIAFLLPILTGSWRLGLVCLGLQSVFLALMVWFLPLHQEVAFILQIIDLGIVRGFVVPTILVSAIKNLRISPEYDFIPTNFIYWAGLFFLVGGGLWFGYLLFPNNFERSLHCGSAAAGMLTAFYVLALQPAGLGQIFAILLLENSIMLFELLNPHHHSYVLQIATSIVFVFLILVFRNFLKQLLTLMSSEPGVQDKDII